MPIYEVSKDIPFCGLYVDLFFDPPGKLTNLRIDNVGEGYDKNDPPTIEITGGDGSGAVVLPTIIGDAGGIRGVKFLRDPNLGDLRGAGYLTTKPTFTFVSNTPPITEATMDCGLSTNNSILNVTFNQLELLRFCVQHEINFLLVEGLKYMDWSRAATTNPDAPGTAALRNFISRAHAAGITKVSAVINGSKYEVDNLMNYQKTSFSNQRFDAVTFKREYWRGYGNFSDFISKLSYLKSQNDLLGDLGPTYIMELQTWLGWFSEQEAKSILPLSNRILLDDFSPTRQPDFKYMESRLELLANAGIEVGETNIRLYPVFSSERILSDWNGSNEYLGAYFVSQTLKDAWYKWGRIQSGTFSNGLALGSFNSSASSNVGDNINPRGLVCFNYGQLRDSFGNPPPCLARIAPEGPIYSSPGSEVILSATPIGTLTTGSNPISFLWSNSETGSTITATTTGSYSVDVTYGNGCVATSNVVDIYFRECNAYIEYEGPLVLNEGESVILSGSSGNSWTWYRDDGSGFALYEIGQTVSVPHSNTGDFYVEIDNGLGCIQNSETITISNNLEEDCNITIDSSTPLFFASASSFSSVTVSVYPNTGSDYIWSDGYNGQTREISETNYYRVTVVGGSCPTNAVSEYFYVSGTDTPIDQIWTDDNYPANWNSVLATPEDQQELFWTEYNVNLTNITAEKFYGFFKLRSTNGNRTGIRFAVNKTNNFIPITGIKETTFGWYRVEVDVIGLSQIIQQRANTYYIQFINRFCEMEEFLVSEDPNLIPGAYPNFSYVG